MPRWRHLRPSFVTCLCLTRNRRNWLPTAIRHYQAQTHPNRELLILADGDDVRDLIPNDESIRLVEIEEGCRVGEKRNFGCSLALGDIIAHWDDDDYSAPARIEDQARRLETSGKAVTGYNQMRFTDGKAWWSYDGTGNWALGTSLCYRKEWWRLHPFPAIHVGEDGQFVGVAQKHKQIVAVPAGDLMTATIHQSNTSPRQLSGSCWRRLPDFKDANGL